MAQRRVTPPLDGADGYLRWKESMMLALHSVRVAYVLTDDPPSLLAGGGGGARPTTAAVAVAKQWACDDAVCRGHILAGLSDRLLPDYAHHATGRAVWEAVARTYGAASPAVAWKRFTDFEFDEGRPFLEQIAHSEALGVAGRTTLADGVVAGVLCEKLPPNVRDVVKMWSNSERMTMDTVWAIARAKEVSRLEAEGLGAAAGASSPEEQ